MQSKWRDILHLSHSNLPIIRFIVLLAKGGADLRSADADGGRRRHTPSAGPRTFRGGYRNMNYIKILSLDFWGLTRRPLTAYAFFRFYFLCLKIPKAL